MSSAFVFRLGSLAYRVVDIDMNTLKYSGALGGGIYYFAVDNINECFFVCESNVLKKRSLNDGSLLATQFESVGVQYPFVIDSNGNVWAIDSIESGYGKVTVRKWSNDLSSRIDYVIDSVLFGLYGMDQCCLTLDGEYFYVSGFDVGDGCVVMKFRIDGFNGNNYEWRISLFNSYEVRIMQCDLEDNLFIAYRQMDLGRLGKLNKTDGAIIWSIPFNMYIDEFSYCYENGMMYAVESDAFKYMQINGFDGSIIARTASINFKTAHCAIYNNNYFLGGCSYAYGGGTIEAIRRYDIDETWIEGEIPSGQYAGASNQTHTLAGDPTGYIHSWMGGVPVSDIILRQTNKTNRIPIFSETIEIRDTKRDRIIKPIITKQRLEVVESTITVRKV